MKVDEIQKLVDKLPDSEKSKLSDGYHTFDELYKHRRYLFIALANFIASDPVLIRIWKSKKHYDGSKMKGWFIAGMETMVGQITYHLPIEDWELYPAKSIPRGMKWDGHTSNDVLNRLLSLTYNDVSGKRNAKNNS